MLLVLGVKYTINFQRAEGAYFACVTCIGTRVSNRALKDLAEPLSTHGIDSMVLPWLQLVSVLNCRGKTKIIYIHKQFKLLMIFFYLPSAI